MNINTPPLAEIVELLSRKWMMRIIWELRGAPLTFRALQGACDGVSPTVLNNRLKALEAAVLIQKAPTGGGYELTVSGQELLDLYAPLNDWALKWRKRRTGKV